VKIVPQKGEALVLVFLASWCVPCQLMIGELKRMEKKHNNSFSKFVYVFTHDTKADASAFIKAHKLGTAVLATRKIIDVFNQPSLPSIFVADRQSLMVMRRLGVNEKGLNEVDRFLDLHNSL
jgi:thiol-disulfide isomerase/thioredoxin